MSIYSLDGDIIGSGALRGGGDLVDARGRSGMVPSSMTFDARQSRPILADVSPRTPRGVALPGTSTTTKPTGSDVGTTTRFYRAPGTGTGTQQLADVLRAGINEAGRVVQGVSSSTAPVSSPPPPPPAAPWYEAGWVKAAGAVATLLGLYYLATKKG